FVEVDRVLVAADLLECSCSHCTSLRSSVGNDLIVGVRAGDQMSWGAFHATILSPAHFRDEGGNDDSVVMCVGIDPDGDGAIDARALFCGDAESEVLKSLIDQGTLGQVDIFKVGHHGSKGAFTYDQLAVLDPQIALVSAGQGNRYGHPNQETIELLEKAGVVVLRTDVSGDVVCKLTRERIEVSTIQ
ncbi:MAG: DNA internalization-related competence protein ComEC/Rec2, partial [Eggerthellaceae bacterium]|nr:DNA internalization-related competence protein ComEC/Rec2 [Eggerthellaceae bacterium]